MAQQFDEGVIMTRKLECHLKQVSLDLFLKGLIVSAHPEFHWQLIPQSWCTHGERAITIGLHVSSWLTQQVLAIEVELPRWGVGLNQLRQI